MDENKSQGIEQPDNTKQESAETSSQPAQQEFVWGDGLHLEIAKDKMSATIEVDALKAEHYSENDIFEFLNQNAIDEERVERMAISSIFANYVFNRAIPIAEEIPAQDGEDGYVEWTVDLSVLDGGLLIEKKGRVDFKDQSRILQVEENELLARLIEPTEGVEGKNVLGEPVASKAGKPAKFPAGKGVRISEDGMELYSEMMGVVCKDGEKVSVSPTYTVQGDISFKTGNVDFDETVVISGEVKTDFKVRAGQDLHINGLVEGAKLEAGGSIFIEGGVQGDDKATIRAGGDITIKFVNNARIEANGSIFVKGAITQSIVKAKGRILLDDKKGVIIGGHVAAEKEIIATVIGSDMGVKTIVELGQEVAKMKEAVRDHNAKIETLAANYRKLREATDTLNHLRDLGKITPQQTELRLKIIRSGLQLQAQIKQLKDACQKIQTEIEVAKKGQRGIGAREMVHPGVTVVIMGRKLTVKTPTSKPLFRYVGDEIETFAFKEQSDKKPDKKKKESKESKEEAAEDSAPAPEGE